MDIGQVGFKDENMRKLVHKVSKDKVILKLIQKSMKEEYPDLELQWKEYNNVIKREKVEAFHENVIII